MFDVCTSFTTKGVRRTERNGRRLRDTQYYDVETNVNNITMYRKHFEEDSAAHETRFLVPAGIAWLLDAHRIRYLITFIELRRKRPSSCAPGSSWELANAVGTTKLEAGD